MRTILHSDLNNFYASCECLLNPDIKDKAVVVGGSQSDRHGVVLAKNYKAKSFGIKTGDTLFEARQKCPDVVYVEAHFSVYQKYAKLVKDIYREYTDRIESFGIDEAWLDVTESINLFGSGEEIAEKIRKRVKEEIGLTVSIGVSYNKIFAKLGSDLKKPDAVTIISPQNYMRVVWPLKVEELLYVGRATKKKLNDMAIYTIGDLACTDENVLISKFGKWGEYLYTYANGKDSSPVLKFNEENEIKSIGNSLTFYRDLTSNDDVKALIYMLSESVSSRMKDDGKVFATTVRLWVVDKNLNSFVRQTKIPASGLSSDIGKVAMQIFLDNYKWLAPVRGVGVSVCDFCNTHQLYIEEKSDKIQKLQNLESVVEDVRRRYGRQIINRAMMFKEARLVGLNIKEDHVIHPEAFHTS